MALYKNNLDNVKFLASEGATIAETARLVGTYSQTIRRWSIKHNIDFAKGKTINNHSVDVDRIKFWRDKGYPAEFISVAMKLYKYDIAKGKKNTETKKHNESMANGVKFNIAGAW